MIYSRHPRGTLVFPTGATALLCVLRVFVAGAIIAKGACEFSGVWPLGSLTSRLNTLLYCAIFEDMVCRLDTMKGDILWF